MANTTERFTITFHNADASDAVRQRAEHLMTKLARFFPSIMRGTMVIEGRHRHRHQGNVYHIALKIHLPGGDVVVTQDPEQNHAHEDIYVAMRDACEAARKQLSAFMSKQGGKGAQHEQERYNNRPERLSEM